jgi:predicted permease
MSVLDDKTPGDKAERSARYQVQSLATTQENFAGSGPGLWGEQFKRDVAYALRLLVRNPGFTMVAVLSLALGIGANAFVFSVVNALVFQPLPVDHPERLVFLETKEGHPSHSFPNYRDIRDRNQTFTGLAGYRISPMEMESHSGPERIWGYLATGNYFDVLGVRPWMGRFFHQEDDLSPGASPYAVLSYGCWRQRFGSDPGIVGKTIRINRQPYTVLGVSPAAFHGTELFYWPDVWVPMMMQAQVEVGNPWLEDRSRINTWIIGRLKPGVTTTQARENLNAIAADLSRQYPLADEGLQFKLGRPGLIGDTLGGPAKAFAIGVLFLAALVLLTACANLASLLTARGADRRREIAIRLSMGATRGRLVRQILTETTVLSMVGGVAGYGLAVVLSRTLSSWHLPIDFPVLLNVNPDLRVLFFAFVVSVCAGVVFGSAPASQASKTNAYAVLKGEPMGWRHGRLPLRDALVVLQVALCFVLVSGCLLALRGLQRSVTMNLGFQPKGVVVVGFQLGLAGYSEEQGRNFQRHASEVIGQLPGVRSIAYSNSMPLSIDQSNNTIYPESQPNIPLLELKRANVYEISPEFFETMGIERLLGRDLTWHDDPTSPPVAIVNRTFGKQILHTENPIGKRFRYGPNRPLIEIVGVVEDGKYESLAESPRPAVFEPILQSYNSETVLIVKSFVPDTQMLTQMRQAMLQLDPHLPLYGAGSLEQELGFAFFPSWAAAIALSAFGLLAIVLAATGIHGVVSYAVARRVREIGIRMAIGARPPQVIRLVLGRITVLLVTGSLVGLGLSLAAGQVLASIVYGTSPRDPQVLAAVCITIGVLGLIASWGPTRRALRIDPMVALRHE